MYGFYNSADFKVCDDSEGRVVVRHSRELGEKLRGMYPKASWSDVVINDVDFNKSMEHQGMIECIETQRYLSSLNQDKKQIFINGRNVDGQMRFSEKGAERYSKGEGKYFRKRGATKHGKDHETKPKRYINKPNKIIEQEKYEDMREEIFDPIYDGDPCELFQGYDLGHKENFRCWKEYGGPGWVKNGMFFPPPQWIYPHEDQVKIWTHMHAVEGGIGDKYVLIYHRKYHPSKKPVGIQFYNGEMDDCDILESDNYKSMVVHGSMHNTYIYGRIYRVQAESKL